jgi:hypothetical protein
MTNASDSPLSKLFCESAQSRMAMTRDGPLLTHGIPHHSHEPCFHARRMTSSESEGERSEIRGTVNGSCEINRSCKRCSQSGPARSSLGLSGSESPHSSPEFIWALQWTDLIEILCMLGCTLVMVAVTCCAAMTAIGVCCKGSSDMRTRQHYESKLLRYFIDRRSGFKRRSIASPFYVIVQQVQVVQSRDRSDGFSSAE